MGRTGNSRQLVQFGNLELDLNTCELHANGRKFDLQGQPFQILKMFLEHPGQLITREELKDTLWQGETFVDFDHSLNRAMNRLREALEDSAENPRFIETLPRRGYRFIAPVEVAADGKFGDHDGLPALANEKRRRLHRIAAICEIVLVLTVIGIVALITRSRVLFPHVASSSPVIRSLAVLPLESLSSDPEQEYFADGLTDELITQLGQIHALRVISRNSVMPYKRVHKSLPQIARELNVDAVVEGTVRRSGNRVRITAQLIQVPADRHLWARSYNGDLQNVLALQENIAVDIATQVRVEVTATEQAGLKHPQPVSPEANKAYFRGRYFWEKRGTAGNTQKALRYFEQAIHYDPRFAAAYAALAETYAIAPDYSSARPHDSYDKAEAEANKAVELDSHSVEAHTALALVAANNDFNWQLSEIEFKRALDLNPGYANAHHWHAFNLMSLGRLEEAVAEINQARDLDPLSTIVNANVGFVLYHAGLLDRAIEAERKCLELDPDNPDVHRYLGLALLQEGQYGEALRHLRRAVDLSGGYSEYAAELSYGYAAAGNRDQATKILMDLEHRSQREYVSSFSLAVAYAGLGNSVAALSRLQRAIDERCDLIPTLKVNPLFANLRYDARFTELLRRIGLAT